MNDWQNWVLVIILLICFGWVAYKIYNVFMKAKRNESPCSSCATGCSLRNLDDKDDRHESTCTESNDKKVNKKLSD